MKYDSEIKIEVVNKGWSSDKKYRILTSDNQPFLLRVSPLDSLDRKRVEFEKMEQVFIMNVPISKPIEMSIVNNEVHSLFSWIEGMDANDRLIELSNEKQFELGLLAGGYLKKIHQLPAPDDQEPWEDNFNRKIDRNIHNYQNCGLKYEHDHLFLEIIEKYRPLIKNRPSSFQHGDFHTGNMILSPTDELSIIDFNRWSYGDPWEEFNRIDFSAQASQEFARGQIDGYFLGKPPREFFELMALYICSNTLNSLPWATTFSHEEVTVMLRKASLLLEWYDGFKRIIPKWYEAI